MFNANTFYQTGEFTDKGFTATVEFFVNSDNRFFLEMTNVYGTRKKARFTLPDFRVVAGMVEIFHKDYLRVEETLAFYESEH